MQSKKEDSRSSQKIHFDGLKNLLQGKHAHDCVVLFYAEWCGFCKEFLPTYDMMANRTNLPMYKINLAKQQKDDSLKTYADSLKTYADLLKENAGIASAQYDIPDLAALIQGYPTTILFFQGKWLDATISAKHPDGTYDVSISKVCTFSNQSLPVDWMRPKKETYEKGDEVECYRTHVKVEGGKSESELVEMLNKVYGPTTIGSE